MKQYFGIDIGGTAVKLGIVDETGKVLCKGEQSVNFDGYETPVLDTVRKAAKEFLNSTGHPGGKPFRHRRVRHRPDRQPQGHRGRYLRQFPQLHRQPHQGRAGSRTLACPSRWPTTPTA